MKGRRTLRVVLPIIILMMIGGVWWLKSTAETEQLPLELTNVELDRILSYGKPVLLDFGASWCMPCQQMAPHLRSVYEKMQGKALVFYVEIDKYPDAAKDFPVRVVPTQFFYTADGKPYVPSEELKEAFGFILYSYRDTGEHVFTAHEGALTEEQMLLIFADMGVE
ncbi:MAG TPA: thioredoxin family protein [Firmicutes bacterium]|nr:thioredoxin family protein [Bacillota bacterium]